MLGSMITLLIVIVYLLLLVIVYLFVIQFHIYFMNMGKSLSVALCSIIPVMLYSFVVATENNRL